MYDHSTRGLVDTDLLKERSDQGYIKQRFRCSLGIFSITFLIFIGLNSLVLIALVISLLISTNNVKEANREKNALVLTESVSFIKTAFEDTHQKIKAQYNLLINYPGERDWNSKEYIDFFCQSAMGVFRHQWYTAGVSQFGSNNIAGGEVGERMIILFVYNKDMVTREPRPPHLVYSNSNFYTQATQEMGFNVSYLQTYEFKYPTELEYSPYVDWDDVANISTEFTYKNKKWYTESVSYHTGADPESYFFIDNINWRGDVTFMLTRPMFPDHEMQSGVYSVPDSIILSSLRIDVFRDFIKSLAEKFGGKILILELNKRVLMASSDDEVRILDDSKETPGLFNILEHPSAFVREVGAIVLGHDDLGNVHSSSHFTYLGNMYVGAHSLDVANAKFMIVSMVPITNSQLVRTGLLLSASLSFLISVVLSTFWVAAYYCVNNRLVKMVRGAAYDVAFILENLTLGFIQVDVSGALEYFGENYINDIQSLPIDTTEKLASDEEKYFRTVRINETYKELHEWLSDENRKSVIEWMVEQLVLGNCESYVEIPATEDRTLLLTWKYYQDEKFSLIVYSDISDLKRMYLESEKAIRQVTSTKAHALEFEKFIAGICHEIRNPLLGIQGTVELLEGKIPDDERRDLLACCEFQNIILSNTIDLSKQATQTRLTIQVEGILQVCKETIGMMQNKAEQNGNVLTFSPAIKEEIFIRSDIVKIKQIMANLLSNAAKFTSNGKIEVFLKVRESEEQEEGFIDIFISVKDTGIGIAKKNHKKIFGRFSQADENILRKFGGSGLGLYLCQKLAHSLNGRISFKSEEGAGSTFYLSIFKCPLRAKKPKNENEEGGVGGQKTGEKPKIIFADDQGLQLRLAELALRSDFDVVTCNDGAQAVEAFKKDPRAVSGIVLDYNMFPGMGGLEAAKALRKEGYRGNIMLCTGAEFSREEILEQKACGITHQFRKPYKKDSLMAAVHGIVTCQNDEEEETEMNMELEEMVLEEEEKPKVIFADDVNLQRKNAEKILSTHYDVLLSADAVSAVELYKVHGDSIAAVCLDVKMPGEMTGLDACQQLRSLGFSKGIMLCTAFVSSKTKKRGESVGVTRFLGKPYKMMHLLQYVREMVDNPGKSFPEDFSADISPEPSPEPPSRGVIGDSEFKKKDDVECVQGKVPTMILPANLAGRVVEFDLSRIERVVQRGKRLIIEFDDGVD